MRLENLNQPLVLSAMIFKAFEFVAAGTKRATRRAAQAGDILVGFEAGINQVFGQRADDAIATGKNFPDFLGMATCFLNQAARRRIDDGGNAP